MRKVKTIQVEDSGVTCSVGSNRQYFTSKEEKIKNTGRIYENTLSVIITVKYY